ncbi:MAG TPA: phenylalanine--tRNA ligase subunit beta, partial [Geminicoccaceae bacterium]|nr:phenylalanine--tRNA ligase subunit beta [Geminicoccaceae bacterium]
VAELCGGQPGEVVVAGAVPAGPPAVRFRRARLPRLAGIELEAGEIEGILRGLGFALAGGPDEWQVTPPSWRHDIQSEACIVEELARLHGYDRIPPVPVTRTGAVGAAILTAEQRRRGAAGRAVADLGYAEAVTWSFVPPEQAVLFGPPRPILKRNPLNAELAAMRPSLLPNLLAAAARNLARKHEDGALFELGPRFTGALPGEQTVALAGVRYGAAAPRHWVHQMRPVDAFDVKADALAALAVLGVKPESVQVGADAPGWYHPGRSGCLRQGRTVLVSFGELHPDVLRAFDVAAPVAAFELDVDAVPAPKPRATKARPPLEPLPYPPVDRDFAFVVDAAVPAAALLDAIKGVDRRLIRELRLFDVYAGEGVGEGRKSLAVAVRLQAPDRTLTDAEIEAVSGRIVAAAEKAAGAVLRR